MYVSEAKGTRIEALKTCYCEWLDFWLSRNMPATKRKREEIDNNKEKGKQPNRSTVIVQSA